jgi:GST-like protein
MTHHTLYGAPGCGSAMVEAALVMAGVPYRLVQAASWEKGPELDELAAANPMKQIPTLRLPDGSVMTESAAILIHLGLMNPASGLLPAEPAERAQILRALVFIAANCYANVSIIDYPERWSDGARKATRERVRASARARLHEAWDLFADTFEAQPFLGGDAPCAADLMAAVVSRWSGARAHLRESRPAFSELLLRVEKHASVVEVFARHWPP